MLVNPADVKKLREITGAPMMSVKNALEESGGDFDKATEILRKAGQLNAAKKADRQAGSGLIESYVHAGKIGVLVEVNCETDFVARTDDFKIFVHDIAMQIAATEPADVSELLKQPFVKDPSVTIEELNTGLIAKLGENIVIRQIARMELGQLSN